MTPEQREQALCAQVDPDLWFPEKGAGGKANQAARRICGRCPVQAPCLNEALANHEDHGIWGGLSRDQRRKLAVERQLTTLAVAS